jgi:hypothetical protein
MILPDSGASSRSSLVQTRRDLRPGQGRGDDDMPDVLPLWLGMKGID